MKSLSLLLLAAFAAAQQPWEQLAPGQQPWLPSQMTQCWHEGRWQPEGTPIVRGRYHYTCRGGELQPQGCVIKNTGRQVRIGESWVSGEFQHTCIQDGMDQRLKIKITGCAPASARGRAFRPGESWNDPENKFWFTCEQANEWSVQTKVGGCVDFQGRRIPVGDETTIKGITHDIWWICGPKPNGAVGMCVGGCMHNGQKHRVGDTWPNGEFVFYCKVVGEDRCDGMGRTDTPCIGCQKAETVLVPPDSYTTWWTGKDEIALACKPGSGGNGRYILEQFPINQVPQRAYGLRFSFPRGK